MDQGLLPNRARRLLGYLGPHRGSIAGILGLALTIAAFGALEPLVLKFLFDNLGAGQAARSFALALGLFVAIGLAREAASALSNWLTWRTRIRVQYALTQSTVERLHTLPISFHRQESVGATMTRLDRGIQGLVAALHEVAFSILPAIAYLAIAVTVMVRLDLRLALVVGLLAPAPALLARLAAPEQTRREKGLFERWTRIYSRFNEVLAGIVTVKSFAMEHAEKKRFLDSVDEANGVVLKGLVKDTSWSAAQGLTVLLARIAVIAWGGVLVMRGEFTVGTLVAFLGYVGGVFAPLQGLSGVYKTLRVASVSAEQIFGILDAHDGLADAPDAREPAALRGEVEFERVRFGYEAGGPPLIDGLDLRVRPGETVALVGPSGAGKTTLMSLLQRFHDPDAGVVRVDGHDVRALKQLWLRRQIGVVLQDALLFNDSIRANIAYGRPEASMAEIEAAARAAHAHDFISRMPQGYQSLAGERGGRLSAGERQRIAIARSLLKDPAILILDEPTSALDAESEALVQEALTRLMKGRTTFLIAHRLSTVVDVDRILVLANGRIVEQGPHARLLEQDGYYASLVRRQVRGLFPASAPPPPSPGPSAGGRAPARRVA